MPLVPVGVTAVVAAIRVQVSLALEVLDVQLLDRSNSVGLELASVRTNMIKITEVLDGYEATRPYYQHKTEKSSVGDVYGHAERRSS